MVWYLLMQVAGVGAVLFGMALASRTRAGRLLGPKKRCRKPKPETRMPN